MRSCFLAMGFHDFCCLHPALLQSDFKLCHPLYQVLGCKANSFVITKLLLIASSAASTHRDVANSRLLKSKSVSICCGWSND